jgi:hypothetical protein
MDIISCGCQLPARFDPTSARRSIRPVKHQRIVLHAQIHLDLFE